MSHNPNWRARRYHNQNQNDDRYYAQLQGPTNHPASGSSYAQPYGYDYYYYSNGYYPDSQPSHAFNYWRDDAHYPQNQYQESFVNHSRSHEHYPDVYYHAESSYSRQRHTPQRQYHSRAEAPDLPRPYLAPPSFRRNTPDMSHPSAAHAKSLTPPPPPPAPVEPDPAYTMLSLEPSHVLNDPRTSRKLLILDLNGTLLIRSQHVPRMRQKVTHDGTRTGPAPRLRAVQPRPYIPAFRAYLCTPETQEWLDTMVWSSAQPHSVADMIDKVFGDFKSKLVAVWDRVSLGLSKEDYFRKSQTTKDLSKPWALLPLGTSPAEIATQSEVGGAAEQAGLALSVTHSAMTTLLLDDSPAKARLQPYNHVCIPEYDSSLRGKDLQQLEREKTKAKSPAVGSPMPPRDYGLPEACSKVQGQETRTSKKRRKKKNPQVVPEQMQSAQISSASSDSNFSVIGTTPVPVERSPVSALPTEGARLSSQPSSEPYDPTLLAVIGVLDEIKRQSNVAGWMRGGGLWNIAAIPVAEREMTSTSAVENPQQPADPRATKRLAKKERKGAEKNGAPAAKVALMANTEVIQTGNDESSTANIPVVSAQEMWFTDENTLAHWVGRGRRALANLGIEAAHGVTG